ncbi:hypothetical protein DXB04_08005 [Enterocloster bolteae]|nr:hypothetical protein DXB04_08005 [Enterocloster bolteae]
MGSDNTNRRTVETEFKKAMVRVNVPVGLLVTAFGIGLMVLVGSYLIKYFRGAVPLREVYGTEQAGDEYVSFDINYVLDASWKATVPAAGCAPRAVYIIWCWMRRRELFLCVFPVKWRRKWTGLWTKPGII